ncbi:MAG: hypothetical protein HFE57_07860 [Firmicutes bacterium]|jgi:hypothetical protein|nr:hypothetical protein [Bacillota bacterium]
MKYHLKLKKALSYCGIVTATKKQPDVFVEDEETANQILNTGYFELVEKKKKSNKKIQIHHLSQKSKLKK